MPDLKDERDYKYSMALGVTPLTDEDWTQGYDAEKELGITLKQENQGNSYSCVGQSTSKLFELKLIEKLGITAFRDYSARFVYTNISIGAYQGAYLRDGMKFVADKGCALESLVPSYENGEPPNEPYMLLKDDIIQEIYDAAKKLDYFNYRVIDDPITIETIAHAVKNHNGVMIGFVGSNNGWVTGNIRAPRVDETTWGHAVVATQFGKDVMGKWIGGPNWWSERWGNRGYWKAYENNYFTPETIKSVFNPWVFVWDNFVPDNQRVMDYLKRNANKLVQNADTGEIGIIKREEVLVTSSERAGLLALTTLIRNGYGGAVPQDLWNQFTKKTF